MTSLSLRNKVIGGPVVTQERLLRAKCRITQLETLVVLDDIGPGNKLYLL